MRYDGLTARQLEIGRLVADGWTDAQIAERIGIHVQSVRYHIWRIVSKWDLDGEKNVRVLIAQRITSAA